MLKRMRNLEMHGFDPLNGRFDEFRRAAEKKLLHMQRISALALAAPA